MIDDETEDDPAAALAICAVLIIVIVCAIALDPRTMRFLDRVLR